MVPNLSKPKTPRNQRDALGGRERVGARDRPVGVCALRPDAGRNQNRGKHSQVKPIRLTRHAREQARERGATESEVKEAVVKGAREPAKHGRLLCRYNFGYGRRWQGKRYAIKQLAPVIKKETGEQLS